MPAQYQLTPEQLAKQEERRLKKLAAKAKAEANGTATPPLPQNQHDTGKILEREWVQFRKPDLEAGKSSVKVMTWNLLAQTLVRRELFPSSDCLRGAQREHMIPREILTYKPDIACLQEVDRLDKLLPPLQAAGYSHTYTSGRGKSHGCMVIHREESLRKIAETTIYLDEEVLQPPVGSAEEIDNKSEKSLQGVTRRTKNIALIVGLEEVGSHEKGERRGYLVATCHLFWHPLYTYERTRQGAIILRSIAKFQAEHNLTHWPIFFAGDFNSQPHEPLYALLSSPETPLTPAQRTMLTQSQVIHLSIDPSVPPSSTASADDDDEGGGGGAQPVTKNAVKEDQTTEEGKEEEEEAPPEFTNSRLATKEDGLLNPDELQAFFSSGLQRRSAYDEAYRRVEGEVDNRFGARPILVGREGKEADAKKSTRLREGMGSWEPMWTSFTHFWRLTLDYIWIIDSSPLKGSGDSSEATTVTPPRGEIIGILKSHRKENIEPGLPKLGVCASDHVALMVEIEY